MRKVNLKGVWDLAGFLKVHLHLLRSLWRTFGAPKVVGLIMVNTSILSMATLFYTVVEGWTILDAAYFSVVTAATIGYGDFVPATALGKLFTLGFVFVGVGLFVVLATAIAAEFYTRIQEEPLIHDQMKDAEGND